MAIRLHGLFAGHALTHDRNVLPDDVLHTLFDPAYFGFRNIFHALYLAVKALRHGMFDVELPIREQVAYRFVQDEEERPLVNAHTFEVRDVDKADGQRRIDPVREFFEAVVDVSRQQRGVVPFFQRQHLRDLQQAGALVDE